MEIIDLQRALSARGHACGEPDGRYGPRTRSALLAALTDGPDTPLSDHDILEAAHRIGCTAAHIKAVWSVESAGAGFSGGRPTILFEPHRFSRATEHRFDASAPDVSYPKWDKTKYPKSQDARYAQLIKAVGLDVDAGFASASYGAFQILGENYEAAGFETPFEFAVAHATDEASQLAAFVSFVKASGLADELMRRDWTGFARGYNGTAYKQNKYDERLAAAFLKHGGVA